MRSMEDGKRKPPPAPIKFFLFVRCGHLVQAREPELAKAPGCPSCGAPGPFCELPTFDDTKVD